MTNRWRAAAAGAALVITLVAVMLLRDESAQHVAPPQALGPARQAHEVTLKAPDAPASDVARSAIGAERPPVAAVPVEADEVAVAQPPTTGLLTGRVVDEAGEPIPGARVGARFLATREFSMLDLEVKNDEREVAVDTTDDEGRFELEVPAAHPMDVEARRAGYATAYQRGMYAGEDRDLVLGRAATFMGRIVRADNGRPVAGVPMRGRSHVTGAELFEGKSGPDGSFRFEDLPAGPLSYEVEPEDLAAPEWVSFELTPGEVHETTIQLETGITVFGRVSDATTGATIAGAEIWEGWFGRKRVTTAADGTFRLKGFGGPGVYDVHVHASGYGNAAHEFNYSELPNADIELNFELEPARRARGRVVDRSGHPVEGAYVAAIHSSFTGREQQTDWESARTDAAGQYDLPSLHPGLAHTLFVRKAGFGTVLYGFPGNEMEVRVVVLPDVVLPAPARVEGAVVDERGNPRAGVKVQLTGWNADAGALLPGAPREFAMGLLGSYIGKRESSTDSLGRFAFADLSAGTYVVKASAAGGGKGREQEVEVDEGAWVQGLRIELARGLSITGRVVDPDGEGVVQAFMTATSEETGKRHTVMSGAGGAFELIGLEPGRYRVVASPTFVERGDGSAALAEAVRRGVEAGAEDVELVMPVAASLEGVVLGADGEPFHGAFVFVNDTDGRQVGWAVADEGGGFAIEVVPGAPLSIHVRPTEPDQSSPFGFTVVGSEADGASAHGLIAPAGGLTLRLSGHSR